MTNLIAATDICTYHGIEYTFIDSLREAGLVKFKIVKRNTYVPETELQKLEKLVSLYELDINVAGIEAISHLLDRVEKLQEDMRYLKNRLSLYE